MSNHNWKLLSIPFKGERTYLQSANVWDTIADIIMSDQFRGPKSFQAGGTILEIIFKQPMTTKVELHLTTERPPKDANTVAQVVVTDPMKTKMFGALRSTDKEEEGRFADIEEQFRKQVVLNENSAEFGAEIPISLSQLYVAMIKFWHQEFVDGDCKWLATRLQIPLSHRMGNPKNIEVKPGPILAEGAGSISDITARGITPENGRIHFYKIDPAESKF